MRFSDIRDPELRERTEDLFAHGFDPRRAFEPRFERFVSAFYEAHESRIAREPAFRELGLELLQAGASSDARRWGAVLLTGFPDREVVERVAAVLDDADAEDRVRAQAAYTLGFRRLARRPDDVFFPPEALDVADRALVRAFERGLHRLPLVRRALRGSASPELFAAMLEAPLDASECVLAFASPALARAFLAAIDAIAPERAPGIVRLAASVLGTEAVPSLLALAEHPSLPLRLEALFGAMALDGAAARPAFDALVGSFRFPGDLLARRDFHLAHAGEHPVIRALEVAMTTATLPREDRDCRATAAARALLDARDAHAFVTPGELDDLALELAFRGRAHEPTLLVRALAATPASVDDDAELADAYLEALGRTGRFLALLAEATRLGRTNEAAHVLAFHGRPFLALRARLAARFDDERALEAEGLALFLAGRPDLVDRDPTPWLERLAPAPEGADPDLVDVSVLARFAERPASLDGAAVFVARDVPGRQALVDRLEAAGARIVDAPFVGTHFYVLGDSGDAAVRARLDRVRARPLPSRWVS